MTRVLVLSIVFAWPVLSASAQQTTGTALIRHAPTLNGSVRGSIQQMSAENTTLNGGASVTGDLLVPGTPTVRLNGSPTFGGTLDGPGASTPANYTVALNGGASLGHLVRRTNPVSLPTVAVPPQPTGTNRTGVLQAFNGDGAGGGTWLSTEKGPVPDAVGHATGTSRERWVNPRLILADDKICAAKAPAGIYQAQSPVRTCPGVRGHPVVSKWFPYEKIFRRFDPLV